LFNNLKEQHIKTNLKKEELHMHIFQIFSKLERCGEETFFVILSLFLFSIEMNK
jgi:hypothetical protein